MATYRNIEIYDELIGKTFDYVYVDKTGGEDELHFIGTKHFRFYHEQDCCECVSIEDITGDLEDLVGEPLVEAESVTESGDQDYGTYTYTTYKFRTKKGIVTVRWYGTSNGYYSEHVYFEEISMLISKKFV